MTAALVLVAVLGADDRPDWWRVTPVVFKAEGKVQRDLAGLPAGSALFDATAYAQTMGVVEQCRTVVNILDQQLAGLYDLHLKSVGKAKAEVELAQVRQLEDLRVELANHLPTWQVVVLVAGAGAAGVLVGLLVGLVSP